MTFWKKALPAPDINGLAGSCAPKTAKIKAGSPADIKAAQCELAAWLVGQPAPVRAAGTAVISHLYAAMVSASPHPEVKRWLVEDIANLERARALVTSQVAR